MDGDLLLRLKFVRGHHGEGNHICSWFDQGVSSFKYRSALLHICRNSFHMVMGKSKTGHPWPWFSVPRPRTASLSSVLAQSLFSALALLPNQDQNKSRKTKTDYVQQYFHGRVLHIRAWGRQSVRIDCFVPGWEFLDFVSDGLYQSLGKAIDQELPFRPRLETFRFSFLWLTAWVIPMSWF